MVDLGPAAVVSAADGGVVVEQRLGAERVRRLHDGVVEWRQTACVLVVRRRAQVEQRLKHISVRRVSMAAVNSRWGASRRPHSLALAGVKR